MKTSKPTRCNYCQAPATVWAKYQGHIARTGRPGQGGAVTLYASACAEHEGCVSWISVLAGHPEAEVCRG